MTIFAGQTLTADDLNGLVEEPEVEADAPTMGEWTIGDGEIVGNYLRLGDWVWAWIRVTIGSTTVTTGNAPSITLPFPALSQSYVRTGTVRLRDVGGSPTEFHGAAEPNSFQSFSPLYLDTSGAAGGYALISDVGPFTWATGDQIVAEFVYQVDES